jgi:hypothetical protein
MSDEIKTVEVADEPVSTTPVAPPVAPTRDELKNKGWSKSEMDSAEKRGMINNGANGTKPTESKKVEPVPTAEKTVAEKKPEPVKNPNSFLDDMDKELTPEQEKYFLEVFPPGTKPRAFYFRQKNERQARQRAEAERDRLALELQVRKDAEARIKTGGEAEPEVDAEGNVVDPEDRPLTMKQLKAMQKIEQEKLNKQQEELQQRSGKVADAMKTQEEYAKSVYTDFDDTVKLATELVNNMDLIPDPVKQGKLKRLLRDLQATAATADQFGIDDYTASMIAYEMGQLHPNYGQKPEPDGPNEKKDPKANGGHLTPEQMKRIEENAQRRASSASLPGSSGRRVISVEDVTIKDILGMSPEERYAFKKKNPDRMAKLMRG